jgi:hypothetical protein
VIFFSYLFFCARGRDAETALPNPQAASSPEVCSFPTLVHFYTQVSQISPPNKTSPNRLGLGDQISNYSYCGNGTPLIPEARVASQGVSSGWLAGVPGLKLGELAKSKNSSIAG